MKAATCVSCFYCIKLIISIHAAREGGDHIHRDVSISVAVFQSTPPVKAATNRASVLAAECWISIHAAREGGDRKLAVNVAGRRISIHAAREGGDVLKALPPATPRISIHAAREGGDRLRNTALPLRWNFNPRRP